MTETTSNAKRYTYTDQWGNDLTVFFAKSTYNTGSGLFVECYVETVDEYDGETYEEAYTPVSVNFGVQTEPDTIFVDANNSGHLVEWMLAKGLATLTGNAIPSGFCVYPEVRLSQEFIDGLFNLAA